MENNNIDYSLTELSTDCNGIPDNLARSSVVIYLDYSSYDNNLEDGDTDEEFAPDDPRFDWYLDTYHNFELDDLSADFKIYGDDELNVCFSNFRSTTTFDFKVGNFGYPACCCCITLIFDKKNFEVQLYSSKYCFTARDLAWFLHNECEINNFDLIHNCDLLYPRSMIRDTDIIHINGSFDKYLCDAWNKIMHSINGNPADGDSVNVDSQDEIRQIPFKDVRPNDPLPRRLENLMVREDAGHLPCIRNKTAAQLKRAQDYHIKFVSQVYSDKSHWKLGNNISPKVFEEHSNRDYHIGNYGVRLDVPITEGLIKPDQDKVVTKIPESVIITDPGFNVNGELNDKEYIFEYIDPLAEINVKALHKAFWFGRLPKLTLRKAVGSEIGTYYCFIFYIFSLLYILYRTYEIDGLIFKMLSKTVIGNSFCLLNTYFMFNLSFYGPIIFWVLNLLGNYFGYFNFSINYLYPLTLWTFNLVNIIIGNNYYYLLKFILFYFLAKHLYNKFYYRFSFLNVAIDGTCIGRTYFTRKVVLRKECGTDMLFDEQIDQRKDTDNNFKIKRNSSKWFYDEYLSKHTEIGVWNSLHQFEVRDEVIESLETLNKIVDLELVTQMSTARNLSMNCSPEMVQERLNNCTNMGPFINNNRKDALFSDVMQNCSDVAFCIAMSFRYNGMKTNMSNQLFRKNDTWRLTCLVLRHSHFY